MNHHHIAATVARLEPARKRPRQRGASRGFDLLFDQAEVVFGSGVVVFDQLEQIKVLLFTHQDENCQMTSVHNEEQSVARPLFPLGDDREVQKCGPGAFVSDEEKGRGDGNKCRAI